MVHIQLPVLFFDASSTDCPDLIVPVHHHVVPRVSVSCGFMPVQDILPSEGIVGIEPFGKPLLALFSYRGRIEWGRRPDVWPGSIEGLGVQLRLVPAEVCDGTPFKNKHRKSLHPLKAIPPYKRFKIWKGVVVECHQAPAAPVGRRSFVRFKRTIEYTDYTVAVGSHYPSAAGRRIPRKDKLLPIDPGSSNALGGAVRCFVAVARQYEIRLARRQVGYRAHNAFNRNV